VAKFGGFGGRAFGGSGGFGGVGGFGGRQLVIAYDPPYSAGCVQKCMAWPHQIACPPRRVIWCEMHGLAT